MWGGGNDLSYLNHIIIVHYNASYRCGRCLKQAFFSSSVLHTHKKVCLRFTSRKAAGVPDGKPSSGRGNSGHGGSSKATLKKGWQGSCHQLPGLECPFSLSAFTTPQWTGDIPPPQVPQEGFRQEVEKGGQCEPGPEKRRTQGLQGWGPLLNRHPTDIYRPTILSNKNFVTQLMCLL